MDDDPGLTPDGGDPEDRDVTRAREIGDRLPLHAASLDAIGESVIVTDPGGTVLFWNRAAENLLGWTADEARGRDVLDVTPAPELRRDAAAILDRLARGETWSGEITLQRKDGTTFPAHVTDTPVLGEDGSVQAIVGVSRDLTERKAIQGELRRSQAQLDAILESLPVVLFATDRDGRFILSRGRGLTGAGLVSGELVGQSGYEVYGDTVFTLPDGTTLEGRELIPRVVAGETFVADSLVGDRIFLNRIAPIRDPEGGVTGIVGVALDVTEGQHAEEELRESRRALQALARNLQQVREEEQVRIAREVHDELGQGLTALAMDTDALRSLCPEDADAMEILDRTRAVHDGLLEAVRRIATGLRPGVLDDMGLAEAVRWYVDRFQARTTTIAVAHITGTTLPPGDGGGVALFRILQEALTNVNRHARAKRVDVRLDVSRRRTLLEVEDDGVGIPDPTAVRHSLGILGMRERAQALGGDVTLETSPSGGTLVRAVIPAGPGAAGP